MDNRQAIYQNCHVITVVMSGSFPLTDGILVDNLKPVVMDVFLVMILPSIINVSELMMC